MHFLKILLKLLIYIQFYSELLMNIIQIKLLCKWIIEFYYDIKVYSKSGFPKLWYAY